MGILLILCGCSVPTIEQKEEPPSFYHELDWISKEIEGCKAIEWDVAGDPIEWVCPEKKRP